jgi:hypothetical protein
MPPVRSSTSVFRGSLSRGPSCGHILRISCRSPFLVYLPRTTRTLGFEPSLNFLRFSEPPAGCPLRSSYSFDRAGGCRLYLPVEWTIPSLPPKALPIYGTAVFTNGLMDGPNTPSVLTLVIPLPKELF